MLSSLLAAAILRPPNVVLIVADDLGWGDLACYGNEIISTPNLDALAERGVRLTDFYAGAPMCSPSRTTLLTGRQPQRAGIYDWIPPESKMNLRANYTAFPELLKRQGWQTALSGKWHLNGGMEIGQTTPSHFGFDDWFAVQYNDQHLNPTGFFRNGKPENVSGYSCQIVADDAIDWLESRRDPSRPFFQLITFQEPHEVVMSPPRLVENYDQFEGTKPLYYANVEHLDEAVGKIVDSLDSQGLSDNTLLIFTSDHGPAQYTPNGYFRNSHGSAGPFRGYKRWLLEGGLRVPGIFVWPDEIEAATTSAVPCGFRDLFPTLIELSGAKVPEHLGVEGVNLLPALSGEKVVRKDPLNWHFHDPFGGPQSTLREGRWVLNAWWDVGDYAGGRFKIEFQEKFKIAELSQFKLYDIVADPGQTTDVAASHPEVLRRLSKELRRQHHSVRDEAPIWSRVALD